MVHFLVLEVCHESLVFEFFIFPLSFLQIFTQHTVQRLFGYSQNYADTTTVILKIVSSH